jgi:hypothetical protein
MCYSAEVSLGTFAAVTVATLYLWIRNTKTDRGIALLLFIISFMQLLEYYLWINPTCNDTNKLVSGIIPIYLYLQPALIAFVVWQTNAGVGTMYPWIIIASLIGLIPYFMFIHRDSPICIHKGECGHLDWKLFGNITKKQLNTLEYAISALYYSMIFYVIATLKNAPLSNIMLVLYGVSWLVTNTMYTNVWGSVWCHSANAAAIAAVLMQ